MLVQSILTLQNITYQDKESKLKLKASGHNHSMSIFRPLFIFSRSDGQFVAIFPSNFPMTPRSASIHAWALNPARKKKKKFRILFPQNHFIFLPKVSHLVLRHLPYGTPRKHSWSSAASS